MLFSLRLKNAAARGGWLLNRRDPAGSWIDHCCHPLVTGGMLRNGADNLRKVISQPLPDELPQEVSKPDVVNPATDDAR